MTQSDNIVEFLSYASPRIDYIEHCMEKQAISAATVIRAAEKARKLARTGGRQSKGKLTRLTGSDNRALRNADGSLAFMYKDPSRNGVYRVIGDNSEGFGQKFLLDPRTGKVTKTFDGYKNPHHSNLNGAGLPSQTNTYALGPVAPKANNTLGPVAPKSNNVSGNVASKSNNTSGNVKKTNNNTAADTAPASATAVTNWIKRHPYMALGGGLAAGSAAGAGIGYGMGNSSGQQTGAATAQRYYELRAALDRQRLRQTNDSFLSRLGNLFGAGDLSNMIG